jgi:hypothetical protein
LFLFHTTMERVTLKLKYAGQIRRCNLERRPVAMEEVHQVVKNLFPQLKAYSLSYLDEDGDKIRTSSDCELQEALEVSLQTSSLPVIRLDVEEHEEEKEKVKKEEEDLTPPQPEIPPRFFHPAICDACDRDIENIRYKCVTCPDYDLCSECEKEAEKHHDPTHPFLKLTPQSAASFYRNRTCPRRSGCPYMRRSCPVNPPSENQPIPLFPVGNLMTAFFEAIQPQNGAPSEEPKQPAPKPETKLEPKLEPKPEPKTEAEPEPEPEPEPAPEISEERKRALDALLPMGFDAEALHVILDLVNDNLDEAMEYLFQAN